MHIIFNSFAVMGLIFNMIGTFFIIKYYMGFKESIRLGGAVPVTLEDQKRSKKEKSGFKILFIGFLFQFISTTGHTIYHIAN